MKVFAALGFLTRLPLPTRRSQTLDSAAAAQGWFPAVGLMIGGILVGFDLLARQALPEESVAVLLVGALVAITGAMHLDGLADSADGLWGGRNAQERLTIMRDTNSGTYAIAAVICALGLKWAGIAALPGSVRASALLLVPCLSRLAMLMVTACFPPARLNGLGATFHQHAWPLPLLGGAGTGVVAAVLLFGVEGIYALAFVAVCAVAVGAYGVRMVGGMTGDLCGMTTEVTECMLFILVAALANRGWLSPLLFG